MCKRHVLTICVLLASVRDFHARLPEGTRGEIAGQELRAWDMLNLGQLDMIDGEHTSPRAAVRRETTNRRMGATNHP